MLSDKQTLPETLDTTMVSTRPRSRYKEVGHVLTVYFIQDKLISGQIQFSKVEVSDVSISLLEKKSNKCSFIIISSSMANLSCLVDYG